MYQNTFINSTACIGRNQRSAAGDHFGWHPSTGPDVGERDGHIFVNNLLAGDKKFKRPLLDVWQPNLLCKQLNKPQLKQLDYNVYVRDSGKSADPLILWSPANNNDCQLLCKSVVDFQKYFPEFSDQSRHFSDFNNRLFKSMELKNYELRQEFAGSVSGTQIPIEVAGLLGLSKKVVRFIGAYPPKILR